MKNALVSVITPSYNSEKFIAQTIASVQSQTHANWEMIIVDDASSDNTVAVVRRMAEKDSRVKLHVLDTNSGAGVARQFATDVAQGRYIAFLDADDLWKPEKLEKQIGFLSKSSQGFAFSAYDCIDQNGKPTGVRVGVPKRLSYRLLFFCNFVGNLTGIYDTEVFGRIPISKVRKRQDWMLWLHVLKRLRTAESMPQSLAYYRQHSNSLSASKVKLLKDNYRVYRDFHGLNPFYATLAMGGFLCVQLLVKPRFRKILKQ